MLEDEDVRRWYDNLAAKSMVTAEGYLRTLGLFCELNKITPRDLALDKLNQNFQEQYDLLLQEPFRHHPPVYFVMLSQNFFPRQSERAFMLPILFFP